ncbi:MAG: hypothetical protein EBS65_20370 [Betaproteobacteria bacterium]|nr:hypothetical protein [Betaproteobacteria bacterium]
MARVDGSAPQTAAQVREIRKNKPAWRYFEAVPPGERRLARLIKACAEARRLLEWGRAKGS